MRRSNYAALELHAPATFKQSSYREKLVDATQSKRRQEPKRVARPANDSKSKHTLGGGRKIELWQDFDRLLGGQRTQSLQIARKSPGQKPPKRAQQPQVCHDSILRPLSGRERAKHPSRPPATGKRSLSVGSHIAQLQRERLLDGSRGILLRPVFDRINELIERRHSTIKQFPIRPESPAALGMHLRRLKPGHVFTTSQATLAHRCWCSAQRSRSQSWTHLRRWRKQFEHLSQDWGLLSGKFRVTWCHCEKRQRF